MTLLIEINRTHEVVDLLEVPPDVDHEISGVHVAEKSDEAALVELDELLGETDEVKTTCRKIVPEKRLGGNADDMLFDNRVVRNEILVLHCKL